MAWVPPGVEVKMPETMPLAQGQRSTSARPSRSCSAPTSTAWSTRPSKIFVEYEPLPVVVDPEKALEPGSPLVHEDIGTNHMHRLDDGRRRHGRGGAEADVVVERRIVNHRTAGAPIEPRRAWPTSAEAG